LCGFNISIIKILSSLNTTIYFDVIKKEKQLHVSARGHRQVGSFGFARKNAFCNALLIYNDWRGDETSFYAKKKTPHSVKGNLVPPYTVDKDCNRLQVSVR
jgi:hypothetical protein